MWWTGRTEAVEVQSPIGKKRAKARAKKEREGTAKRGDPPRTRLYHLWQATGWTTSDDVSFAYRSTPSDAPSPSFDQAHGVQSSRSQSSRNESRLSQSRRAESRLSSKPEPVHLWADSNNPDRYGAFMSSTPSGYAAQEPDLSLRGKDEVLTGAEQLALTDDAVRYQSMAPRFIDKQAHEYAQRFKNVCRHKYASMVLAWRFLLDETGIGRVPFTDFAGKAKMLGFKDVKKLWVALDINKSGFLTLEEWDPVAFRNLYELREICMKEFGGIEVAFAFGMDRLGSGRIDFREFERFCVDFQFSGDPKVLFAALDRIRRGYLTVHDFEFLSSWEGERYSKVDKLFDFPLARLHQAKAQPKFATDERERCTSAIQRIAAKRHSALEHVLPGFVATPSNDGERRRSKSPMLDVSSPRHILGRNLSREFVETSTPRSRPILGRNLTREVLDEDGARKHPISPRGDPESMFLGALHGCMSPRANSKSPIPINMIPQQMHEANARDHFQQAETRAKVVRSSSKFFSNLE